MTIVIMINNYLYGMAQTKRVLNNKENTIIEDSLIDSRHHFIAIECDEDTYKYLKNLYRADLHDNVNKKSAFTIAYWKQVFTQRLNRMKERYGK